MIVTLSLSHKCVELEVYVCLMISSFKPSLLSKLNFDRLSKPHTLPEHTRRETCLEQKSKHSLFNEALNSKTIYHQIKYPWRGEGLVHGLFVIQCSSNIVKCQGWTKRPITPQWRAWPAGVSRKLLVSQKKYPCCKTVVWEYLKSLLHIIYKTFHQRGLTFDQLFRRGATTESCWFFWKCCVECVQTFGEVWVIV